MLLAGAPTDLSFLDPVDEADAPPQAVRLAAGELLLRIAEERRRRAAGLGAAGDAVPQRRMTGKAGARPAALFTCAAGSRFAGRGSQSGVAGLHRWC